LKNLIIILFKEFIMDWKIPLSEPDLGQEEIDTVISVIKSKWLTMGAVTAEFEKKFAEKMNVKYAFAVNNATAALHIANVCLNIKEGDEVICPALTFVASANASKYTGAKVVFADITDENDWTISVSDIKKLITKKTKAIVVVHYAGFSCNMEEIMNIAKEYNLKVIEDCAHSPFAAYKFSNGEIKSLGSIGDVGCFSFFGNKNMTTGEGGMVTTNSDEIAQKIKLLRSHGMTTLTYERHKGHASGYDVVELGYNYRIDEIRSAIGISQLNKIDYNNTERRRVYKTYMDYLSNCKNVIFPFKDSDLSLATPHIMPIILKNNYLEIKNLLKEKGIQTSKHYDLVPNFSIYKEDKPFVSKIEHINNILTLPLYPGLKQDDIKFICDLVSNY